MPVLSVLKAILQGETGDFAMDMKAAAETAKEFGKEARDAGAKSKDMSGGVGALQQQFKSLVTSGAIVAAGTQLMNYVRDSVTAAEEANRANAQLEAVIRSTGGAAGVSAEMAQDYAQELMKLTGVEDDLIVKNEAILLTFKGVGASIFPAATKAALDMSAAFGQDLRSSMLQLGKALNDPIEGLGALRRVGVSFTTDQEKLIKSLVESGKTMEAQQLILEELQSEFGGAAEAMHEAGSGADDLTNSLGNLQEAFGQSFIGPIKTANTAFSGLIDSITSAIEAENAIKAAYESGLITLEESNDLIFSLTWTGYDAADAMAYLAAKQLEADRAQTRLIDKWKTSVDEQKALKQSTEALAAAQEDLAGKTDVQKQVYDEAEKALREFNVGEATRLALEQQIDLLSGKVTEEEQRRAEAIGYLTQQLSLGNLTQEEYLQALQDLASSGRTAREIIKGVGAAIEGLPDSKNIAINVKYNQKGYAPIGAEPGGEAPVIYKPEKEKNYGGKQAGGGPLNAGWGYWTGENGPEPFFPAVNGLLLSNAEARAALAGAGKGVVVNVGGVQISGPVTPAEAYQAGLQVGEGVRAALRAQGRA